MCNVVGSVRRSAASWWLVCALCALGAVLSRPLAAAPSLTFDDGIAVRDATPGASVVLLGAGREVVAMSPVVRSADGLVTVERDGAAFFDPGWPIPDRSIWAAVDTATGEVTVSTPYPGLPTETVLTTPPPTGTLEADATGTLVRLHLETAVMHVVLVRPGVGAWSATAGDGAGFDEDETADGVLTLVPSGFSPLDEARPAPTAFAPTDVLVLLNPFTQRLSVVALDDATFGTTTTAMEGR